MNNKHLVALTMPERAALRRRASAGQMRTRELIHTRILLKADAGPDGPGWTDEAIAGALDVSVSTIERVRNRFAAGGLEAALSRRPPRRVYRRKLDGQREAHLIALACGAPPEGQARWSLRLLADRMVQLEEVDTLSYQTVRRVLRSNELKPWLRKQWVIPPRRRPPGKIGATRPAAGSTGASPPRTRGSGSSACTRRIRSNRARPVRGRRRAPDHSSRISFVALKPYSS